MAVKGASKGYFFGLDAVLAAGLLLGGLVLISVIYSEEQLAAPVNLKASDFSELLYNVGVTELNNTYLKGLILSGEIDHLNNSLLEQLGEFWAEGKNLQATILLDNLTRGLVDETFNLGFYVNGQQVFLKGEPTSNVLTSASRIVSGIEIDKPVDGFTSRAVVTASVNRATSTFAYLGGFIGNGRISSRFYLPSNFSFKSAYIELNPGGNFNLSINDNYCGTYLKGSAGGGYLKADKWNISQSPTCNLSSVFRPGLNLYNISFAAPLNQSYVGGGYLRVTYTTGENTEVLTNYSGQSATTTDYINGVDGLMNIFSSFYVPGQLQGLNIYLHYDTTHSFFVSIANVTVINQNDTGEGAVTLDNNDLSLLLNYNQSSRTTLPIRIGHLAFNETNISGNYSDVVLTTSRTGTMGLADIEGTSLTRMQAAKQLDHLFVNKVLESSQNRVGLVSYWASTKVDNDLTSNAQTLNDTIAAYEVQNPTQAQRWLCQAVKDAKGLLTNPQRKKFVLLMTDGNATKACPGNDPVKARQDTINEACNDYSQTKISFYAVGFGAGADNALLQQIANCTNGKFRSSTNISGLEEIYKEFAGEISNASVTFQEQIPVSSGVQSRLFPDSRITYTYIPDSQPVVFGQTFVTAEGERFGADNQGEFTIPGNVSVRDVRVSSYSEEKWTSLGRINAVTFFNLSRYGNEFTNFGDPYIIQVPLSLVQTGQNLLNVDIGASKLNTTPGSQDNRPIYTIGISTNRTGFSGVYSKANGCTWLLKFEDGSSSNVKIPSNYNGSASCDFSLKLYDGSDAINAAVFNVLGQLDIDSDGLLDVLLGENAFTIEVVVVPRVPSLWGPSIVEVRVWQ